MENLKQVDVNALVQLKASRSQLSFRQYKTLRGQVLAGNGDAAMKGLQKILNRQERGEASG